MKSLHKAILAFCLIAAAYGQTQCNRPAKLWNQDFGLLAPDDFLSPFFAPSLMLRDFYRPYRNQLALIKKDLGSTIKTDKDKFEISLDLQHFAPEEISVKASGGYVVIEAKHEEKEDGHGFVSRQLTRKYLLPQETEANSIQSELSSDGILTVTAPLREENRGERVIPITPTGPARKVPKESVKELCDEEVCVKVSET